MKKFYGIILLFTALTAFKINVQAQIYPCAGITVEPVLVSGGTNNYEYYGAKVTLDKTYQQDITVNVTLHQVSNQSINQVQTVTVLSGDLTATSSSAFQAGIAEEVAAVVNSAAPSTVTSGGYTYSVSATPCTLTTYDYIVQDPYFLSYVSTAKSFTGNIDSAHQEFSEGALDSAVSNTTDQSSDQDIASAFNAQGFDGDAIVSHLRQLCSDMRNLATTNTALANMTGQQRYDAIAGALSQYLPQNPTASLNLFNQSNDQNMVGAFAGDAFNGEGITAQHPDQYEINSSRTTNPEVFPYLSNSSQSNSRTYIRDICSDTYKDDMEACEDGYSTNMAATLFGTLGVVIFSGGSGAPLALFTLGTGTLLTWKAYMNCRQATVRSWKTCRRYS